MKSYAQNCEDLILKILLPKGKGFYVDVGANLPEQDSVTKLFYDEGWHGINIEPVKSVYKSLDRQRPRDINLNIAVANKVGTLKLREYSGPYHGWSTFSDTIKNLDDRKVKKYKDYLVDVRALKDIFKEYKVTNIDFLKVDVEGYEYEVLQSNDWKRWRPKVVVVENTPGKWLDLLAVLKYREVFFDGLNRYFVRSDIDTMSDCVQKDFHLLVTWQLKQELEDARAMNSKILEHPEDFISRRKLAQSMKIQISRRLSRRK